ncbi:MAG: hypothetical protein QXL16_02430 [Candidatus Micrarchaeaceae archaeon]
MPLANNLELKQLDRKKVKGRRKDMIEVICDSLGLSSETEANMLRQIIARSIKYEGITSKEASSLLKVPRTTALYHLNRLIDKGLIVRKGRRYYLRSYDLSDTLEEMRHEVEREFERLIEFAKEVDSIIERELFGREE